METGVKEMTLSTSDLNRLELDDAEGCPPQLAMRLLGARDIAPLEPREAADWHAFAMEAAAAIACLSMFALFFAMLWGI
jgi:hypothetical protein